MNPSKLLLLCSGAKLGPFQHALIRCLLLEHSGVAYAVDMYRSAYLGGKPKGLVDKALERLVKRNILIQSEDCKYFFNTTQKTWK